MQALLAKAPEMLRYPLNVDSVSSIHKQDSLVDLSSIQEMEGEERLMSVLAIGPDDEYQAQNRTMIKSRFWFDVKMVLGHFRIHVGEASLVV